MNPKIIKIAVSSVFTVVLFVIGGYFVLIGKNPEVEQSFSSDIKNTLPDQKNINLPKTALFLGDIMLDRAVKKLMDKNGYSYPFEKINDFSKGYDKGYDIVVGNLEGPVVDSPQPTPDTSMQFNFGSEVLDFLKYAKINLISLANNHTLDRGKDGLKQTKELLNTAEIDYFGDPINCSDENIYKADGVIFAGLNKTFPFNCSRDEIKAFIEKTRSENKDDFIIVFMHWGDEYKITSNSYQKELAHLMIDVGVDLIIGSHPHVIEEIEQYKNALIFYSLGNFVFDQYFSEDTQKGLAIGMELYDDKAIFRLFPIGSQKSQPYLLENTEKDNSLEKIALESSQILNAQIKNGIIEISRR